MGKVVIKKFDIMSVAKVYGVIGAIIGFILGLIIALFAGVASAFAGVFGSTGALGIAGFGVMAIIIAPITYGIMLFVMGAIGAFIYNIVADKIGGITFES